jgi:hypothetical protein
MSPKIALAVLSALVLLKPLSAVPLCHTQLKPSDPIYKPAEAECEALQTKKVCDAQSTSGSKCKWQPLCHSKIDPADPVYKPAETYCETLLTAQTCNAQSASGSQCEWAAKPTAPPKTCADVASRDPSAKDGEYKLNCGNGTATFWCHDLRTHPKEFLSLVQPNYASYKNGADEQFVVNTTYGRIRISPCTFRVDVTDQTFASTTDSRNPAPQPPVFMLYSAAASCDVGEAAGTAQIDLSGTPFYINDVFVSRGCACDGSAIFDKTHQKAAITGTGFCGDTCAEDQGSCGQQIVGNTRPKHPGLQLTLTSARSKPSYEKKCDNSCHSTQTRRTLGNGSQKQQPKSNDSKAPYK